MTIDEIIKIILAISVSFSIIGISIQIIRLLGTTNDSLKDLRPTIKNFNDLSEKVISDYDIISNAIHSSSKVVGGLYTNIIKPLADLMGLVTKYRNKD
jgi:hypothetical protein